MYIRAAEWVFRGCRQRPFPMISERRLPVMTSVRGGKSPAGRPSRLPNRRNRGCFGVYSLPALSPQPAGRTDGECHIVQIVVRDNNVDQALKALKKKMQREGLFREMKRRNHFEKPSERKAREKAEAVRRARKLA